MAISFDKNKLGRVLTSYNELTNITITIFDADLHEICSAGPWQPYCLAICEDWDRRATCYDCDLCHAHEALDSRKTITYTSMQESWKPLPPSSATMFSSPT